jgi:hypothetical protein
MRRFTLILLFGIFALGGAASGASAQVSDEILKDTAGRYRLSDGKASCVLTFTTEGSIGGYEAKVPAACLRAFPELGDGAVWSLDNGGIVLSDTLRHRIAFFPEQEGGPYEMQRKNGRTWTLTALDVPPPLTPGQQMAGKWVMNADLDKVCVYDIKSNGAGTAGTLKARPGCKPAWAGRGLVKWTRKGETLKLLNAAGKPVITLRRTEVITFSGLLPGKVHLDLQKDFD